MAGIRFKDVHNIITGRNRLVIILVYGKARFDMMSIGSIMSSYDDCL